MPVTIITEGSRVDAEALIRVTVEGTCSVPDGTHAYSAEVDVRPGRDVPPLSERFAAFLSEAAAAGCVSVLVDASARGDGVSAEAVYSAVVSASCGLPDPGDAYVYFLPGGEGFDLLDEFLLSAESDISDWMPMTATNPACSVPPPDLSVTYSDMERLPRRISCIRPPSFDIEEDAGFVAQLDRAEDSFVVSETFSEALLRLIAESGMTEAECYKRANVDRKVFSKIKRDPGYRPSKSTATAFSVALGLSVDEANGLLEKAGYALSRSLLGDVIVMWFLEHGEYDVHKINILLYNHGEPLLGFRG